jgi:hypothetical protein
LTALARDIHEMFHSRIVIPKELSSRLYREREILEALHHFQRTDPQWFLAFRERMERYRNRLLGLGLRDRVMAKKTSALFPLALLSKEIALGLIGLPFALFGAVNNYLPYRLPTFIADRMREVDAEGTVKFLSGLILFPLFYIGQTLTMEWLFGTKIALGYLASLPPTGLFAFYYWIWLRRTRTSFYLALLHLTRRGILQELRLERGALIGEIEKMQEIFLRVRQRGASLPESSPKPSLDKRTGGAAGPIEGTV